MRQSTDPERIAPPQTGPIAQRARANSAVALGAVEVLAAKALFAGDASLVLDEFRGVLAGLTGDDPATVRSRLLSSELALAHGLVTALQTLLGTLVKQKDERGARLVSQLLDAAVRRVAVLAAAHAGLQARSRPVVVAVGHADQVAIAAGGLP